MNRRKFLIGLSACAASTSFVAAKSRVQSCRIVGIGGAGCNLVTAMRASHALNQGDIAPDFVCVDLGSSSLRSVEAFNAGSMRPPIKTLMLAPFGAGGCDQAARAVCLRKPAVLAAVLNSADSVVLVAGLGGGTGGGIAPMMARLARTMGVPTVAAAITPFDFEGARNERAALALEHLRREASVVLSYSNTEWANRFAGDTPLLEIFDALDRQIAMDVRSLVATWPGNGVDI